MSTILPPRSLGTSRGTIGVSPGGCAGDEISCEGSHLPGRGAARGGREGPATGAPFGDAITIPFGVRIGRTRPRFPDVDEVRNLHRLPVLEVPRRSGT